MCSLISHAFLCKSLWCTVWTKAILQKHRGVALILQHLPLCLGRAHLAYTFLGLPGCTALVPSEGWSRGLSQTLLWLLIFDIIAQEAERNGVSWTACPEKKEFTLPLVEYQYPEQTREDCRSGLLQTGFLALGRAWLGIFFFSQENSKEI